MASSDSATSSTLVGPDLTQDEKTGSSDPGLEAWLRGLSDRKNASREAIVTILGPAVFASTTMDKTFEDLPRKLFAACESNPERLQQMVRTPFMDGETPLAWAICNLPESLLSADSFDKQPSVIAALLACSVSGKKANRTSVRNAAWSACCIRNTNSLFQLFNPHSKSNWSDSPAYSIKHCRANSPHKFQFSINDFPTRMLLDGRIEMKFIHRSRLYSVGFSSGDAGEWMFFYRIRLDHGDANDYWTTINIDLFSKDAVLNDNDNLEISGRRVYGRIVPPGSSFNTAGVLTARLNGSAQQNTSEQKISAMVLKNANPYVGETRELRGCIRLSK